VVLDGETIQGIITDGDIRRMIEKTDDLTGIRASDVMGNHPKSIEGSELAANAALFMREHKISQLLATENGKYAGMIHIHDLNKEGLL
jgi:arabinose-5-phosphate isomerase